MEIKLKDNTEIRIEHSKDLSDLCLKDEKNKDFRCNIYLKETCYKSKFSSITSTINYLKYLPNEECLIQVLFSWISKR